MRTLIAMLLLCLSLTAQIVKLANLSDIAFDGWKRVNVDVMPPYQSGVVDGCQYVVGRQSGLDTRVVDICVSLAAQERKVLDLSQSVEKPWSLPAFDYLNVATYFGAAQPALNDSPMSPVSLPQIDGAAITARYSARTSRMMHVDMFLTWYPTHPFFVTGECIVTCSNPSTADLTDSAEIKLTFGDAALITPGSPARLSYSLADGQARAFPLSFVWTRHVASLKDWTTAFSSAYMQIGGVGIKNLLIGGNPTLPQGFNVGTWVAQHARRSIEDLHTLRAPQLGPAADTGQTGSVEDQFFVCGEPFVEGGTGAELVRYFAALHTSGHPMHHLETDGRVVDISKHPNLRMFYSRSHSSGSDRLGKTRDLSISESAGWNGPDAQHWTINTLAGAARIYPSHALQRLLEHHARNYRIQLTTVPGWSTSAIWSARELGWEGAAVVHLWRTLEDRFLAEQVATHWRNRVTLILVPKLNGKHVWDIRSNDARLGSGDWWMPWQQALGCYGIDLACEVLGPQTGRALALEGATRIVESAWQLENGSWVEYELAAVDGRRQRSGMFQTAWMPLAAATVLKHQPNNARARAIWNSIVQKSQGNGRWLPVEVF